MVIAFPFWSPKKAVREMKIRILKKIVAVKSGKKRMLENKKNNKISFSEIRKKLE